MKRTECTDLFLRYREIARLVWNLGFWPSNDLRQWDAFEVYLGAQAKLFEGMVLLALGYEGRVEDPYDPGAVADLSVAISASEARLLVDGNPPGTGAKQWGQPTLVAKPGCQELRFRSLFDWNPLGTISYPLMVVEIVRLDEEPSLVGHHALIEIEKCSIWFLEDVETPGL